MPTPGAILSVRAGGFSSMGFLWVFLWFFYGLSMDFLWAFYNFSIANITQRNSNEAQRNPEIPQRYPRETQRNPEKPQRNRREGAWALKENTRKAIANTEKGAPAHPISPRPIFSLPFSCSVSSQLAKGTGPHLWVSLARGWFLCGSSAVSLGVWVLITTEKPERNRRETIEKPREAPEKRNRRVPG